MKKTLTALALVLAGPAMAEGQLNIYNWGNYTSPEMIEKFEAETGIKVTITDYDSNDTALAKIKAGGHGFDIVVPSGTYIPIFVGEGLLMESNPNQMENFKHMDPQWVDVAFDPGRKYSVPWQWGTVGITVNTSVYGGDINTAAVGTIPSMLESPTMLPAHPPTMKEQCSSPTGKVRPQKKSIPSDAPVCSMKLKCSRCLTQ